MSKIPVMERAIVEGRFFGNLIKEAILHPLSTSVIDKKTGKVVRHHSSNGAKRHRDGRRPTANRRSHGSSTGNAAG